MKTRLDEMILSSDSENLNRLFHLVGFILRSRSSSEHPDLDFVSILGLLESHLVRCYGSIVQDVNLVDWEQSQRAVLMSLHNNEG